MRSKLAALHPKSSWGQRTFLVFFTSRRCVGQFVPFIFRSLYFFISYRGFINIFDVSRIILIVVEDTVQNHAFFCSPDIFGDNMCVGGVGTVKAACTKRLSIRNALKPEREQKIIFSRVKGFLQRFFEFPLFPGDAVTFVGSCNVVSASVALDVWNNSRRIFRHVCRM